MFDELEEEIIVNGMRYSLGQNSAALHALAFAAYVDDETLEALEDDGPAMFLNVLPPALDRIIPHVPDDEMDEDEIDDWNTDFWNALESVATVRLNILKGVW